LVRCMCAIQNNDPYKRFLKSGHSGNGDTPSPDSVNQGTMSSEMEKYNSDVLPYTSSTVTVLYNVSAMLSEHFPKTVTGRHRNCHVQYVMQARQHRNARNMMLCIYSVCMQSKSWKPTYVTACVGLSWKRLQQRTDR
jgi:hypothetical protein